MGRFYKTKSVPFIDYGYDYPYKELVGALEYKQGRQDKSVEALMKAQDALSKVDYVPGTEHEKYLKQKRKELSNQVNQLSTQDLSGSFAPVTSLINDYVSDPNLLDIQRTAEHVKAQELVRQDYIAKGLYHPDYNPINWQESINAGFGTEDYSWRQGLMEHHKGFDQSKADAARRSYFNDMTANQKAWPGAVQQRARDNGLSYALTPIGDQQMRYEGKDPSNMTEAQKEEWGIQALMQQAPEFDNYLVGKTSDGGGGGGRTPDDAVSSVWNVTAAEMYKDKGGKTTVNPVVMEEVIGTEGKDPLVTSLSAPLSIPVFNLENGTILDEGTGNTFSDNYNRQVLGTYGAFMEDSEINAEIRKKEIQVKKLELAAEKGEKIVWKKSMKDDAAYKTIHSATPEEIAAAKKELENLNSYANDFEYLKQTERGKQLVKNAKNRDLDLDDAVTAYPKYKEWKEADFSPLDVLSKVIKAGGITYGIEVSGGPRNMQTVWDPESKKNTMLVDAFATFDQPALRNIVTNAVDDNDNELFKDEEDAIKKLGLIKQVVYDKDGKPTDKMSYKIPYKHVFDPSVSNRWQFEVASGNAGDKAKIERDNWSAQFTAINEAEAIEQKRSFNKQKRDFEVSKFGKYLDEYNADPALEYSTFITNQFGEEVASKLTELQETSNVPAVSEVLNLLENSVQDFYDDKSPQSRADAAFIGASLKEVTADPGTAKFKKDIETVSKNILTKLNTGGDPNDYLDSTGTGLKDIPLYKTRAKNQALSLGLIEVNFENIPNINMTDQVYAPYATASAIEGLTAIGQAVSSPINISGLYRTPAYNNAISHTKKTGVHTQGRGVDVAGASMQILLDLFATYKNMDGTYNRQKLLEDFNLVDAIDEVDHLHLEFK